MNERQQRAPKFSPRSVRTAPPRRGQSITESDDAVPEQRCDSRQTTDEVRSSLRPQASAPSGIKKRQLHVKERQRHQPIEVENRLTEEEMRVSVGATKLSSRVGCETWSRLVTTICTWAPVCIHTFIARKQDQSLMNVQPRAGHDSIAR